MVSKPHHIPSNLSDTIPAKRLQLSPFLECVWLGDIAAVGEFLKNAAVITEVDPRTGITALHIAVGRNNLEMVRALVEAGAAFVPDGEGRMPSVIAAEMEVSEELADYIYEAESRALDGHAPEDV